ncbi:MAG TPA: endonuclease/exonuclease/phosphatase family protein [Pseudonocardiaceae bacterium]
MRLATYNVENLFERARALRPEDRAAGEPVLAAFASFTAVAERLVYDDTDRAVMLEALETLGVLRRNAAGELRRARDPFSAWALLRENRGDFLVAPDDRPPRIVALGRADWIGWVELITEPVDELATRMTARVVSDVAADVLCLVEAEDRRSLARFNSELLNDRYAHCMLIDGNDPRGIDVGLCCVAGVEVRWVRSHVDVPDPLRPGRPLFSRDCPLYQLRLPSGADLFLLLNHFKSQSFAGGDPDPLRRRQSTAVRGLYDALRAEGAEHIAVLGDLNKGPDRHDPSLHPTLEPLLGNDSPLVDGYSLPDFGIGPRPGSFQSCGLAERLDYILLSPELAAKATGGGVHRTGLWGNPKNKKPPARWPVYPEITAARHAASDHAAVWVDLDL